MLDLIQTDPQEALTRAVPYAWRNALPDEVTRWFELQVDGRGALDVLLAEGLGPSRSTVLRYVRVGGHRYEAFVYGRRLSQISQTKIPIHGIALEGKLAVAADPIRLLSPAEVEGLAKERGQSLQPVCGVCSRAADLKTQGVAADLGGELACFCSLDHAQLVNLRWVLAESGGPAAKASAHSVGQDSWTHGTKTVLYMRLNFPDDLTEPIAADSANAQMLGVNAFYAEGSYKLTSLAATVTPLLTLPETKAWYSTAGVGALLDDAREAARLAGYDTDNYDLDITCFTSVPGESYSHWSGLAVVGGKGLWLQGKQGGASVGVTAHELGHNYGLMHANFWDLSANAYTTSIGLGTNVEYRQCL